MCQVDHAATSAAIAALRAAHPRLEAVSHPALAGCDDVAWSALSECAEGVPVLLRGLLVPAAAEEARRLLGLVVLEGPLQIGPVMPYVVPFLVRLAADPSVPHRADLFDLVVIAAMLSEPTDTTNAQVMAVFGAEEDHPERSACRAAFAADADRVRRLLADPALSAELGDCREFLVKAAGL